MSSEILPIFLILLLKVIITNGFYSSQVSFPMSSVEHSIDLRYRTSDDLILPTGSCKDLRGRGHSLYLPRVNLQSLYPGIICSPEVSCLSFRDNQIDRIGSGSFNLLPNLLYLDLSKNRIQTCDLLTFGGIHDKLKTLILDENEIPSDNFGRDIIRSDFYPDVESLYLRNNFLRSLKFSLRKFFPNLKHLYLSDNFIESEHFMQDPPSSLSHLHLERNNIKRLGGTILNNIEFLFLDNNKMRSICYNYCLEDRALRLGSARRLKHLSLNHNEIVKIAEHAFSNCEELTTLNLANNNIQTIKPSTFQDLRNLKHLDLSGNKLARVPNLNRNSQLLTVSMAGNKIEMIYTGSFRELRLLSKVNLSNNKICKIETDAFIDLPSLEELDLSYNRLARLERLWMRQQESLLSLDVRGNYFMSFANLCLESAKRLSTVYLENNPLKSMNCVQYISPDVRIHVVTECKVFRGRCYEQCIAKETITW